jgi:NADH-quinone oxidoreductase subunit I
MKATKPKKKEAEEDSSFDGQTTEENKTEKSSKKSKPELQSFVLDFTYCSQCGLCVQNCPVGSLRFSHDVFLAGFSRDEFVFDLLAKLKKQAQQKEQ